MYDIWPSCFVLLCDKSNQSSSLENAIRWPGREPTVVQLHCLIFCHNLQNYHEWVGSKDGNFSFVQLKLFTRAFHTIYITHQSLFLKFIFIYINRPYISVKYPSKTLAIIMRFTEELMETTTCKQLSTPWPKTIIWKNKIGKLFGSSFYFHLTIHIHHALI